MGFLSRRKREGEGGPSGAEESCAGTEPLGEAGAPASPGGTPGPHEPQALVRRAQAGDGQAREELIRAYRPFVMRVAADTCGRFVEPGDDEASVALIAFDEAISSYRTTKGGAFLRFAETVIRRRLIDHFRKQGGRREVPLSDLEAEDEDGNAHLAAEAGAAMEAYQHREELLERQEEIRRYQALLQEFGISFRELVAVSPRHRDARETAKRVAREIARRPAWASFLMENRALPMRELEREAVLAVSRKTVERNRKYIIAVALLLLGGFEHLRAYAGDE